MEFKAGVTYTLQLRLPTIYAEFYLLDPSYNYITYSYSGGDDDPYLPKLIYTPPADGLYTLDIYPYDYGPYILECVPAPEGGAAPVMVRGLGRVSGRAGLSAISRSRHIADRYRFSHTSSCSFSSLIHRAVRQGGVYSARVMRGRVIASRFSGRAEQSVENTGSFDTRAEQIATPAPDRSYSLISQGWHVYARDLATDAESYLGFVPRDMTLPVLTDIPLPDGLYEIEARPVGDLWGDTRVRRAVTFTADSTGLVSSLPVIQDLRLEDGLIQWRIAGEYDEGAFSFRLWFSPVTPVDTSGEPDQVVQYWPGISEYRAQRAQEGEEYVAMAARSETEVGVAAELFLPWITGSGGSPPNQTTSLE